MITVSWSGAHPTGGIISTEQFASLPGIPSAADQEYPVVLMECRRHRLAERTGRKAPHSGDMLDRHARGAGLHRTVRLLDVEPGRQQRHGWHLHRAVLQRADTVAGQL